MKNYKICQQIQNDLHNGLFIFIEKYNTLFQADFTGGFHEVSTNEERIVAAVHTAFNEYTTFLHGIIKDLHLSLGVINKAEKEILEYEGTLYKTNFEIVYIPAGDTMDCNALILENFAQAFDVKNVSCDCCQDPSKKTNVMKFHIIYTTAITACFHYRYGWLHLASCELK